MPRVSAKYLVVIHDPQPAKPTNIQTAGSYTAATPPRVREVTASSPTQAVEMVDVKPGGCALVTEFSDVRRFNRAEVAPLEETYPSGEALPMVARPEPAAEKTTPVLTPNFVLLFGGTNAGLTPHLSGGSRRRDGEGQWVVVGVYFDEDEAFEAFEKFDAAHLTREGRLAIAQIEGLAYTETAYPLIREVRA